MKARTAFNTRRSGFQLFLLTLPFLVLVFLFSYVPLYGWVYALFDYRAGMKLADSEFVGFKYFAELVNNEFVREDVVRVLRNTFAMSFLGILTAPLPAIFAMMLSEIRSSRFKKTVQTLTTLPNFISWILMYSVVWAIFSVGDGFMNRFLLAAGFIETEINFLASPDYIWLKMVGYGLWKGLGWGAIIYLAAIASIDQELYEAATVDGAGRFQKMWHITVPGLQATFFVLLLLSIANFINNGVDQYYVFQNPLNKSHIEVLDLYVYNQGILGNNISYSTVVGILKTIVSITLLFFANGLSKLIRKESII
ncbi:MAG TPA: ABC transporter permease subunit [Paenibacillus sp.]|nr:ABC transporter permease subunit [Paenibacillus sp.]